MTMQAPATTEPTPAGTTEITVTREIAAPPERVCALFVEAEAMMRWFGIDGVTNLHAACDAREGGAWHVTSRRPDGLEMTMRGTVLAFEPGRRIVQSWRHVDHDGTEGNETEAEILFEPTATGTRVTVHHRLIRYTPDAFRGGWSQSLGRIAALVG